MILGPRWAGMLWRAVALAACSLALPWAIAAAPPAPLAVDAPRTDVASPQPAGKARVRWSARVSGGVPPFSYEFRSARDGEEWAEQSGAAATWEWRPVDGGTYRVQVVVSDASGTTATSAWSAPFVIGAPLAWRGCTADHDSPQAAGGSGVTWSIDLAGGTPPLTITFRGGRTDGKMAVLQRGESRRWTWRPGVAGNYRIAADVTDAAGGRVTGSCAASFVFLGRLDVQAPTPDLDAPQAAGTAQVLWRAHAAGGIAPLRHEFRVRDGVREESVQDGPSTEWIWRPAIAGAYQVRTVVRDAAGNAIEGPWSEPYTIAAPIALAGLTCDRPGPQLARAEPIHWTAEAAGGTAKVTYEFWSRRGADGPAKLEQRGPSREFAWQPDEPGIYQLRVVARDESGLAIEGAWSSDYRIEPRLTVRSFTPDHPSPQPAKSEPVLWRIEAEGGVPPLRYEFWAGPSGSEELAASGGDAAYTWTPRGVGVYRLRGVVRDAAGHRAQGEWVRYDVVEALAPGSLLAVFPLENRAGRAVPLRETTAALRAALEREGLHLVAAEVLEAFLARHRVRYTGGLDADTAQALAIETGAAAALISSVDDFSDDDPPRLAMALRLVSASDHPAILWMDVLARAGDDAPGVLGLGRIGTLEALRDRFVARAARVMKPYLAPGSPPPRAGARDSSRRFAPRSVFHPRTAAPRHGTVERVVVMPFIDASGRAEAGELLAGQITAELAGMSRVEVLEPGVVRQLLLRSRMIQEDGLSLPQVDILREELGVDVVITGRVSTYHDPRGPVDPPEVGFTVRAIDCRTRAVRWAATSHSRGNDGVVFFDAGMVRSAAALAQQQVREALARVYGTR